MYLSSDLRINCGNFQSCSNTRLSIFDTRQNIEQDYVGFEIAHGRVLITGVEIEIIIVIVVMVEKHWSFLFMSHSRLE